MEDAVQLSTLLRTVASARLPVYFVDPDRRELATASLWSGDLAWPLAELAIDPLEAVQSDSVDGLG